MANPYFTNNQHAAQQGKPAPVYTSKTTAYDRVQASMGTKAGKK